MLKLGVNEVMALLFGGMLLLVFFLMIGAFLQQRRERLLTHAERMKSLELGMPLPDDPETAKIKAKTAVELAEASSSPSSPSNGPKSLAYQCYTTTGWVCGLGFLFAAGVGTQGPVAYFVASGAAAVGVTGMICGTILASKEMTFNPPSTLPKPKFDPEAV
jgi:hypothetical protein